MRKLIEKKEFSKVVCDNKECGFELGIENSKIDLRAFIDMECPLCGENLLTQKDYDMAMKLNEHVDFINKWFSWLTLFSPKKGKESYIKVHVHNGVHIDEKTNN